LAESFVPLNFAGLLHQKQYASSPWPSVGRKIRPSFFNCEAWEKQAETIAEHVEQGQELYVEGRLRTEAWEKDGQKHYRTKVIVERTSFGQKKSRIPGEDDAPPDSIKEEDTEEEDVPF